MSSKPIPRTQLGFKDITEHLRFGLLKEIERNHVIRGVYVDWEKLENYPTGVSRNVFYFYEREMGIRGRVFPNDELIETDNFYDLLVKNIREDRDNSKWLNLDCQVYHDLSEGLKLDVKIAEVHVHPCFHIFNQIPGYVTSQTNEFSSEIGINDILEIEVSKVKRTPDKKYFIECKALRPLE